VGQGHALGRLVPAHAPDTVSSGTGLACLAPRPICRPPVLKDLLQRVRAFLRQSFGGSPFAVPSHLPFGDLARIPVELRKTPLEVAPERS
jgi:hypothetical protein